MKAAYTVDETLDPLGIGRTVLVLYRAGRHREAVRQRMRLPVMGSLFRPNPLSGLFRERVVDRLALALRYLVGRYTDLRLAFVCLRFLFFLIVFLTFRHDDPPGCLFDR
jgi:hypothetical protein